MQLIDVSYFVGEIFISGLENTVAQTGSQILGFIKKYEAKYLKELLGETLYSEFVAGMSAEPIEQKWVDLADKLRDAETKESPIANYVYYWWKRNEVTDSVGIGEVKPQAENASPASAVHKMVRAWNEMVDWNYRISDWLYAHPDYSLIFYSYTPFHESYLFCRKWTSRHELFRKINSLNI